MVQPTHFSYVLRTGDVFPMPYGELYRVEDLTQSDEQGRFALLKRVDRRDLGVDAPVDYTRHYIPIGYDDLTRGSGSLGDAGCRFNYQPSVRDGVQPKLTLDLYGHPHITGPLGPLPERITTNVKVGDILPVLDCGYKLLRLVPPNPEKQLIGWVEIDPAPIPLRTHVGLALDKAYRRSATFRDALKPIPDTPPPQPQLQPQPEPE